MIYKWKAPEPFTGTIEIELIKYKERMKLLKEINVESSKDGEVEFTQDLIDKIDHMQSYVEKYVKKVDLKHADSGQHFNSLDSLEYFEEYNVILNEVSSIILNGAKLGNGSKKK